MNLEALADTLKAVANGWLLQGADEVSAIRGDTDARAGIPDDGMVPLLAENVMGFGRSDEGGADGVGEVLQLRRNLMVGEVSLRKGRGHDAKLSGSEALGWTRASILVGVASIVAASLPMRLVPRVCSSLFEAGGTQGHALELDATRELDNALEEV